jgi:hypothetical protein
MKIYDAITANSVQQEPLGPINSMALPWTFSVDVKLEKTFKVGSYQLVPYLWVKNLLNYENITTVYEGTGEAFATGYLNTAEGQSKMMSTAEGNPHTGVNDGEMFTSRYRLLQDNPTNYSNPRMIMVGLRMSF